MSSVGSQYPILIIGGGISGLTLALALGRADIPCIVLEQTDSFSEIGAGLQLSPNATRRLKSLGLDTALSTAISAPSKIAIYDALTNKALNEIPLGATAVERYGHPYWVIARQDLQSLLLTALESCPSVSLKTGRKFVSYTQDETGITAEMESSETFRGRLLVGADGIWSRVRLMIDRDAVPSSTDLVAWRAMIAADQAPRLLSSAFTNVWLGPDSHLVQYRVSGGEKINLVAVCKGKAQQRTWHAPLAREKLFEEIRPWHKEVRRSVMEIEEWAAWPLMVLKPFRPWCKRRLMVVGDAAHAVVPFLAQGAAMAIEDATLLASMIIKGEDKIETIPQDFEKQRFKRCQRVLSKSILNCQLYHARSPYHKIRNAGLKLMPQSFLLRQYDWLYEY